METDFHLLRPWWLMGFLPLGLIILLLIRQRAGSKSWESVCDPHLLPHLLIGNDRLQSRGPYVLLALVWSLCILALAGPVWSKLPQPVFRAQSALVVVLDLSLSMDAEDIPPSRLTRAKHKVLDILKHRQEGQTGLVVFSGEPYVVSPLTEDAKTIAAMVSSLDTSLMPAQGSRPDLALLQAEKLLEHSDVPSGDLLLITDGIEQGEIDAVVNTLRRHHHRVSVLGVGTIDGAPIPQSSGFVKDQDGAIVIPKLDTHALEKLAKIGQGRYATVTLDDQDLETIVPSERMIADETENPTTQRTTELWREEGPWIVLAIVALTVPAFRAGWLGVLFLMLMLTPSTSEAFFGEEWWSRPDQRGARALALQDAKKAATLFEDPSWKGVANYRDGNFQEAVENFSHDDSADSHFNRGNALARTGQLQEALQAYQTALDQAPSHEDAQHNYELIEKLLKKQENQQNSDSNGESSEDQQSMESEPSGEPQSKDGGDQRSDEPRSEDEQTSAQSSSSAQDAEQREHQPSSGSPDEQQESNADLPQQDISEGDRSEDTAENQHAHRLANEPEQEESIDNGDQNPMTTAGLSKEEKTELESQQALKQWLRRIPDDPGGLLRRKFLFEHRRRQEAGQLNSSGGRTW
ncbi:MAG: VWA domain-containing protein [Nitrospirales bacterium]